MSGFRVVADVRVEEVEGAVLVFHPAAPEVYELVGAEAEVMRLVRSGGTEVPAHLTRAMAALVHLGLVEADGWDRRRVLLAGGALAAAGVATIALPSVAAAASSPGGGTVDPPPPDPLQLLINPSFDDGETGWSSSDGFQEYSGSSGILPAIANGALYFSFRYSTVVSQSASVPPLDSYDQIVASIRVSTWAGEDRGWFEFRIRFFDGTDTQIASRSIPRSSPQSPTTFPLSISRSDFAEFDDIASVTVEVQGADERGWAGNYGPIVDFITVEVS